jgi:opacity protein-like surface antigen
MRKLLLSVLIALPVGAFANSPGFDNIDQTDLENVINDFSAVFSHTTVSPASSLGKLFGVELGITGGMVATPGVESLSKELDATSDIASLPHVGIVAAVSLPMGFTAEANFLPSFDAEDVEFKNFGIAGKWTFTDVFPILPVDMAVKLAMTKSELSFTQDQPAPDTKVDFESDVTQLMFLVSKKFTVVEPYVGLGTASSKGKLSATANIFDFTGGTSASKKVTGSQYMLGVNFNLWILKLGLETGKIFDNSKSSAKVSFYF